VVLRGPCHLTMGSCIRRTTAAVATTATLLTQLTTPVLAVASGSPVASTAATSYLGNTARMQRGQRVGPHLRLGQADH
jgi:hypothetical protein